MLNIESENGISLDNQIENAGRSDDEHNDSADERARAFDYAHVNAVARIAMYDDLRSAPRVTEIKPAPTGEYIEQLASTVYEQARAAGGTIPYTVVREVSENFIHARFAEIIVSILDGGSTIRFADQGPGINQKEKAQLPGFTSAVEPMKHFIRGVGSGLPIVKEYLDLSHGTITIEDNLGTGAVVTISMVANGEGRGERCVEAASGHPNDYQGEMGRERAGENPEYLPAVYPEAYPPSYPAAQGAYPGIDAPYQAAAYPAAAPGAAAPAYRPAAYPRPTGGAQPPYDQGYPGGPVPAGYAAHGGRADGALAANGGWRPGPRDGERSAAALVPPLTQRERDFLPIFLSEGALGVTDISKLTSVAPSSTYVTLSKLEQAGLIEKTVGQKRILTDLGYQVAISL